MGKIKSVCVYCGSNPGTAPEFRRAAEELGAALARAGIRLVYGGSNCGLMGAVSRACLDNGGNVLGVITEQLYRLVENPELTETRVVPGMAARKQMFFDESDAFVALPGGFGTAEELLEALAWQTLGLNRKPVALFNAAGFFAPLLDWMDAMCKAGFVRREQREQVIVATEPAELLAKLEAYEYSYVCKWDRRPDAPGDGGNR